MFREKPKRLPDPPRALTSDIEQDTQSLGRMFRIFGLVWGSIGVAGLFVLAVLAAVQPAVSSALVFPALSAMAGGALLFVAWWKRARARRIFRDGIEAEGEVVSVGYDYRVRVNGKNPWRVIYRFQVGGRSYEGSYSCWTDAPPTVKPGDPVVILHDEGSPSANVLWTRVAPLAEMPAVRVAEQAVRVGEEEVPAEEPEHRSGASRSR
jgi:hypothetical protein